jgi:hypothetical protein
MYKLYVRNEAQKIIFDKELKGQLSDGIWENETTDERLWNCEVIVANLGERLGCSFSPRYPVDFCDESMTDLLADRVVEYVRCAGMEYYEDMLVDDLVDLTKIVFGNQAGETK